MQAFADMPMVEHPELHRLNAITASLEEARNRLFSDGMSRNLAIGLESMTPGILEGHHVNSFTAIGSSTKLNVALEAIDFKKGSLIAVGIGVVIGLLVKLFNWIYDRWLESGRQKDAEARMDRYHKELAKTRKKFEEERDELVDRLFKNPDSNRIKNRYGFDGPLGFIYANLAKQVEDHKLTFKEADHIAAGVSHFMIGDREDEQAFAEYRLINVLATQPSATLNGTLKMLLVDPKLKTLDLTGPTWTALVDTIAIVQRNVNLLKNMYSQISQGKSPEDICTRFYKAMASDINGFNRPAQAHLPRLFKISPVSGTWRSDANEQGKVSNYMTLPTSYTVESMPNVIDATQKAKQLYTERYGFYQDQGHSPFDRDERYMVSTLVTPKGNKLVVEFANRFSDDTLENMLKDLKVQLHAAQIGYKESEGQYEVMTRRVIISQGPTPYSTSIQECMKALLDYTSNLMRETSNLFSAELCIKSGCEQAMKILEASAKA